MRAWRRPEPWRSALVCLATQCRPPTKNSWRSASFEVGLVPECSSGSPSHASTSARSCERPSSRPGRSPYRTWTGTASTSATSDTTHGLPGRPRYVAIWLSRSPLRARFSRPSSWHHGRGHKRYSSSRAMSSRMPCAALVATRSRATCGPAPSPLRTAGRPPGRDQGPRTECARGRRRKLPGGGPPAHRRPANALNYSTA